MTLWTTIRRIQRPRGLLALAALPVCVLASCASAAAQVGPIVPQMHQRALALPENDMPEGHVGLPFNVSITAVGGSGLYSILAGGDLPAGLVLVRGGGILDLMGVPTNAGDFQVRVGVTDVQNGSSMSHTYNLHIGPELVRPDLATVAVTDAEAFHASDVDKVFFPAKISDAEIFKFTDVISVFKPLAIIDNEAFKFTDAISVFGPDKPAAPEAFHFGDSVVVRLSAMASDPEVFRFTDSDTVVSKVGVSPPTAPAGTFRIAYSQTFTAVGSTGAVTLTPAGTLPNGIVFSIVGSTVQVHGTPTQIGTFPFTLTAKDTANTSVVSYSLIISKLSQIITFPQPPTPITYSPGSSVTLTATSSAGAAYPVSYSVTGPATVSGSTLTYTGAGMVVVTAAQVGDANYAAATPVSVTIAVQSPPTSIFLANANGTVSYVSVGGTVQTAVASAGGTGVAVDALGFIWSINADGKTLSKLSSADALASSFTSAGLAGATALAFDGNANLWITNGDGSLKEVSNAGATITTSAGGTNVAPAAVVIDISGNVWVTNTSANTITEIIGAAAPVQPLATAVQNGTPATEP